ncbi:MAG: DUF3168 domain-containing protein [Burkholderiales bacterium]|nr:DUF3168 domain-containing protein [Burkholderiales bacterium]
MSVVAATISHLRANAGVNLYVGKRIYRTVVPANAALPYVTVQGLGGTTHEHYQGGVAGMRGSRLQINCYAADANTAGDAWETIRLALDGLAHTTLGAAPYDVSNATVMIEDHFDDYEEPRDASDRGTFSVKSEWHVWREEAVPVRV